MVAVPPVALRRHRDVALELPRGHARMYDAAAFSIAMVRLLSNDGLLMFSIISRHSQVPPQGLLDLDFPFPAVFLSATVPFERRRDASDHAHAAVELADDWSGPFRLRRCYRLGQGTVEQPLERSSMMSSTIKEPPPPRIGSEMRSSGALFVLPSVQRNTRATRRFVGRIVDRRLLQRPGATLPGLSLTTRISIITLWAVILHKETSFELFLQSTAATPSIPSDRAEGERNV